jgi:hypothetical protein
MDHVDLHLPEPDEVHQAPSSRFRKKKKQNSTPNRDPQRAPSAASAVVSPLNLGAPSEQAVLYDVCNRPGERSADFIVDLTWVSESNRLCK